MWHIENKKQNGRWNSRHITNNTKCEWSQQSNQKAWTVRVDFKKKNSITNMLSAGETVDSKTLIG